MSFEFSLDNVGKSSKPKATKSSGSTASVNNAGFYPNEAAISIPAVPAKKHSAIFVFSNKALALLGVDLNATVKNNEGEDVFKDQFLTSGYSPDGSEFIIYNVTGTVTDEKTLKSQPFSRVTKGGTISNKYIMKMYHDAGFPSNTETVVKVEKAEIDGIPGAVKFSIVPVEPSNEDNGSDNTEDKVQEVQPETEQQLAPESAENAQETVNDTQEAPVEKKTEVGNADGPLW